YLCYSECMHLICVFFFSSRRRHTRSKRDWSSDVCSSDLSAVGQATRTISQPEAVSSAICCRVALISVVGVVVIDCTLTGDSDPTPTAPTLICRVCRRGASTGGGDAGIPRFTDVTKTIPSVGLVTSHDDRAIAEAGPSCGRIVRTMSIVGPPHGSEVRAAAVVCH